MTEANREGVVTTSQRNIRLLDAIADAFATSAKQLWEHATLRYQWMRYLPKLSGSVSDPFWKRLVDKIKTAICGKDLIYLRHSSWSVKLDQARRLTQRGVDRYGNPLFDDLPYPHASYISKSYKESDLNILGPYGLRNLSQKELLERAKLDLSKESSKMKSSNTDDDWHSRAASILCLPFDKNWHSEMLETKKLDLIPLTDGKWVNAWNSEVFFPKTEDGILIPKELDLWLVSPEAFSIKHRADLFEHLGVKFASSQEIRTKVIQQYRAPEFSCSFTSSLEHLK